MCIIGWWNPGVFGVGRGPLMCVDMALLLPGSRLQQWRSPALDVASVTAGALGSQTQVLDFVLSEGQNPLSAK